VLVNASGLVLGYGAGLLLDQADLVLEEGERVGLVGRNGTGKSTLLRLLAGAMPPDAGELRQRPGLSVALLDQEPAFAPGLSVEQVVAGGFGEAAAMLEEHAALLSRTEAVPQPEARGDTAKRPAAVSGADLTTASGACASGPGARATTAARRVAQGPADASGAGSSESAGWGDDTERLRAIAERLDALEAWDLPARVAALLDRHGLNGALGFDTLSGGQRKRVALVRALAAQPDLLLLDEPTNHLDLDAIDALERTLLAWRGSLVVVSHDRRFLDRTVTRILELDRGRLTSHPGSYAAYRERKARMLADEAAAQARFDKLLAEEEVWIRKGIEARRTRNEGRVRRLEQLRREREARRERMGQVRMRMESAPATGQLVAELESVTLRAGGRTLVRDFTTRILRGDRIGLIGPNGAGKTTLLRVLLGEREADEGRVRRGSRLEVAYFDQFREQLDPEARLVDVVSPGSEYVETGGGRQHVIGYLGDFLFSPQRARSPVRALSGGERNRLLLARLFTRPANVVVLDEPTNDLDVETLELLEARLAEFTGTVLVVSHDREFLDNVTTQVIVFAGDGELVEVAGGHSDWERVRALRAAERGVRSDRAAVSVALAPPSAPTPGNGAGRSGSARSEGSRGTGGAAGAVGAAGSGQSADSVVSTGSVGTEGSVGSTGSASVAGSAAGSPTAAPPARRARSGLSWKEARELESLPSRIEALEAEQAQLAASLGDPALHAADAARAQAIATRLATLESDLASALERWEALETRAASGDSA